ncbi:hypothetical protein H0H87_011365 [Tephrocybe sp. NHM501043]|nr:hypothetical protein H0H87_011365 [Tephrocybe sp. NHM501043]
MTMTQTDAMGHTGQGMYIPVDTSMPLLLIRQCQVKPLSVHEELEIQKPLVPRWRQSRDVAETGLCKPFEHMQRSNNNSISLQSPTRPLVVRRRRPREDTDIGFRESLRQTPADATAIQNQPHPPTQTASQIQQLQRMVLDLERDVNSQEEKHKTTLESRRTIRQIPTSDTSSYPRSRHQTPLANATQTIISPTAEGPYGMGVQQLEGLMQELKDSRPSNLETGQDQVGTGFSTTLVGMMEEILDRRRVQP